MKIDILTCSVSRSAGGLLDAIRDLYKKMDRSKSDISVYSYIDTDTESDLPSWTPMDVKLYEKTNPFFYSAEIKKDILASGADILHVHGLWRYPHAFVTSWKKHTNKPVVATPHGMLDPYIISNQGFVKRLLGNVLFANKAFKHIDCYHALCQAELDAIRAFGIKEPVAIIPNGIDMPAENKHYERTDDKKHLLFLGRLHPKKGVDMLLEAIGKIKQNNKQLLDGWIIDIVGWPQEGFDQKLNAIVNKYSLQEYVIFHGGLFGEAKERMYATSDAYILPSHGEGLPMTVLEAWAWGLPVIMTPQCNIPEGFESNAAIKIENNAESIYQNLTKFLSLSNEDQKNLGANGKELVKNHFTWDLSAKKMEELYEWMLEKDKKPGFVNVLK